SARSPSPRPAPCRPEAVPFRTARRADTVAAPMAAEVPRGWPGLQVTGMPARVSRGRAPPRAAQRADARQEAGPEAEQTALRTVPVIARRPGQAPAAPAAPLGPAPSAMTPGAEFGRTHGPARRTRTPR